MLFITFWLGVAAHRDRMAGWAFGPARIGCKIWNRLAAPLPDYHTFSIPARHLPDTFHTTLGCLTDTFQPLSRCFPDASQILFYAIWMPFRHLSDSFQTSSRHHPDVFKAPSRHLPNAFHCPPPRILPSRHVLDTYTFHTNFWPLDNPQWSKSNSDLAGKGE